MGLRKGKISTDRNRSRQGLEHLIHRYIMLCVLQIQYRRDLCMHSSIQVLYKCPSDETRGLALQADSQCTIRGCGLHSRLFNQEQATVKATKLLHQKKSTFLTTSYYILFLLFWG